MCVYVDSFLVCVQGKAANAKPKTKRGRKKKKDDEWDSGASDSDDYYIPRTKYQSRESTLVRL